MGENVTVRGVDLLGLPQGARMHLGGDAVIEITGLRNPCSQLDGLAPGLKNAVLERRDDGTLRRKTGVMATVVSGGVVKADDLIRVEIPHDAVAPLLPV